MGAALPSSVMTRSRSIRFAPRPSGISSTSPSQFSPAAEIITLDRNYRSTQPILAAANGVIDLAAERFTKNLWTDRNSAERPHLVSVRDEADQARYIVERVLENREGGSALKQQAILFRASHHSGPLEVELTRRNIPFVKFGGLKFLEAAHIKDMLALLRFVENPRDRVAGFRVMQLMPGVGSTSAQRVLDHMTDAADPIGALANAPSPPRAGDNWISFVTTVTDLHAGSAGWPAELERARLWYEPHLERIHEDAVTRRADLLQLEQIACGYPSRERFLTELTLDPPDATSDQAGVPLLDEDYLILSTIHSAKGQEWKSVFRAERRRWLHSLRSWHRHNGRDRGGAPPSLCRDDARQGRFAPHRPAALLYAWAERARRPACLCRVGGPPLAAPQPPEARSRHACREHVAVGIKRSEDNWKEIN